MSKATHIAQHGVWTLKRWAFEGAPLFAEHKNGATVEVDDDGDFVVDNVEDHTSYFHVPRLILEQLLLDARARGVIATEQSIPLR